MKAILKTLVVSSAVIAGMVVATSASADDWRWHHHHHHNNDGGDAALAVGIAGLALGAIAGAALSSNSNYDSGPRYDTLEGPVDEQPTYVYRRRAYVEPSYSSSYRLRPWTGPWYEYCQNRYSTFDSDTGNYVGYDGEEHFCRAGG